MLCQMPLRVLLIVLAASFASSWHDERVGGENPVDPSAPVNDSARAHVAHASSRPEPGPANASRREASLVELDNTVAVAKPPKYRRYVAAFSLFLLAVFLLLGVYWMKHRGDEDGACLEMEVDSETEEPCSEVVAAWENTTWLHQGAVHEVMPSECVHIPIDVLEPKWTVASLTQLLASHDAPAWDEKALQIMVRELTQGKARLCKSGAQLLRVLDMVVVLLVYEPDQLVLQVLSNPAYKRDFATLEERTIKARMRTTETLDEAVGSCIEKTFGATVGVFGKYEFIHDYESQERYDHMPGLTCLVRKHVARCSVTTKCPDGLKKVGLPYGRLHASDYVYSWSNIHEMYNLRRYKEKLLNLSRPTQQARYFNTQMLRHGPSLTDIAPFNPWSNSSVLELFEEHGFSFASGAFGLATVDELVRAMQAGRLELGVRRDTKELVGVVDVVSVIIKSRNDMFLGRRGAPPRLLYVQKLPNETVPAAASRLTREKLSLPSDLCHQEDGHVTCEVSDSLLGELGLPGASAQKLFGRGYTTRWSIDVDVQQNNSPDV